MGKQIFIGLATEGTTDVRFLESIVKRTFEDIALKECQQDIDIYIFVSETAKQGNHDIGHPYGCRQGHAPRAYGKQNQTSTRIIGKTRRRILQVADSHNTGTHD